MTLESDGRLAASNKIVVVVGAINVDLVVAADRLARQGETVVGRRLERYGGGKGANAAVAAARAGAAVRLVGAVGADDTGSSTVDELRAHGIDVSGIAVVPGEASGVALVVVDPWGENQIAVGAGANSAVTAKQVSLALSEVLGRTGCVLVSTEIPEESVVAAVEAATSAGVLCILNPAPVVPAVLRLLRNGPLLTPNATELIALVDALDHMLPEAHKIGNDFPDDLQALTERARSLAAVASAPVVVTIGGAGALVFNPDGPARPL